MPRTLLFALAALLTGASASGQSRTAPPEVAQRLRPVTGPTYAIEGTLDLRTGRFTRGRPPAGRFPKEEVYDNTCASGTYFGLLPAGVPGTGGPLPETVGDYGAVPNFDSPFGDAFCDVGIAESYELTQLEIAWCQLAAPVTGSVIWLDVWNPPHAACEVGLPVPNPPRVTQGVRPPAVSPVFSATLTGLPRSNPLGTLACYVLNVTLVPSGFDLDGSSSFSSSSPDGDHFAWAFTLPTTTGADGPLIAGDANPGTPCAPCAGTIFEVGGQTTGQGTGAGNDEHWFLEDYGGTTAAAYDCYVFGGASPPAGLHLELFAQLFNEPGLLVPFCVAFDGALGSCPCAPGADNTGCDSPIPAMQGGGTTGGILLFPVEQITTPQNRATLRASGFPPASVTPGVVFRNTGIDPNAPVVFGDGIRCVDATSSPGTFVRIGASIGAGGVSEHTFGHGSMAGSGTFFYQLWFRSTPTSYCDPSAAFNLSSGIVLEW